MVCIFKTEHYFATGILHFGIEQYTLCIIIYRSFYLYIFFLLSDLHQPLPRAVDLPLPQAAQDDFIFFLPLTLCSCVSPRASLNPTRYCATYGTTGNLFKSRILNDFRVWVSKYDVLKILKE